MTVGIYLYLLPPPFERLHSVLGYLSRRVNFIFVRDLLPVSILDTARSLLPPGSLYTLHSLFSLGTQCLTSGTLP